MRSVVLYQNKCVVLYFYNYLVHFFHIILFSIIWEFFFFGQKTIYNY